VRKTQHFEYKTVPFFEEGFHDCRGTLVNKAASEGWRLVAVITHFDRPVAIMERPVDTRRRNQADFIRKHTRPVRYTPAAETR
jgi:Domain of unknown function (DUF4177)